MGHSILVTGVPRSGKTWLARALSLCPGTAALGREPMNPKDGQYGLAGEVRGQGWVMLESPTERQRRILRRAYSGRSLTLVGTDGRRQWRAVWPHTKLIVTDPFALLSLPAIAEAVAPTVVLLYRHPGAIFAAYRERGWSPDVDELRRFGLPVPTEHLSEVAAMGLFYRFLYETALNSCPRALVVSHQELSTGPEALRRLAAALALRPPMRAERYYARSHDQDPQSWQRQVSPAELVELMDTVGDVFRQLDEARLPLNGTRAAAHDAPLAQQGRTRRLS